MIIMKGGEKFDIYFMTKEEFLEKARYIHGYKYEYLDLNEKIIGDDIITLKFNDAIYSQRVCKHFMGRSPEKNTPTKTTEEFIIEAKKVWGDKYDYSLTKYNGALRKVIILFEGIKFEQRAISHLEGLAVELKPNGDYFLKKAKEIWGDKYDYSLVEFKNVKNKVKIIYNDVIYLQSPESHLSKQAIEKAEKLKVNTEKFIIRSNEIHDFKYDYSLVDYKKSAIKVNIICPIHGTFKQTPNSHLLGAGCQRCKESRGEKIINNFFIKNNIIFNRQHRFDDCKNKQCLPFDFYIPHMRCCIEFDGEQHYKPLDFFGGIEAYEKLKVNDAIKTTYCEENFIDLIRIKFTQIDKINEILSNYFNIY